MAIDLRDLIKQKAKEDPAISSLVDKYEKAVNDLEDIQHRQHMLRQEADDLSPKVAARKAIETRAWNRLVQAVRKGAEP